MTRSIQQLPNTVSTTEIVEVPTTTGFNVGDVVYYQNGNYVSPNVTPSAFANPGTSLTFNINQNAPLPSYIGGSSAVTPTLGSTSASGVGFLGGSNNKSTAVLTNGNIVQVWEQYYGLTNPKAPYFQIVTSAGVQVVAPTAISTTYLMNVTANITVCALSGGGFAVLWINAAGGTAQKPCYAVYTNAGAVTTAATNDTTYSQTTADTQLPSIAPLPNGGFVTLVKNTSGVIYYKIWTSTGTQTVAWTTTGITSITSAFLKIAPAIAVRSTSEFIVADITATTQIKYAIFTAAGATTVAATAITSNYITFASTVWGAIDATILTDGTTYVIALGGLNKVTGFSSEITYIPIPAGNTVGTELPIPTVNLNSNSVATNPPTFVSILGITGGGYVIAFNDSIGSIKYAFFNSSGVATSGTNLLGTLPLNIPNTYVSPFSKLTIIELTGAVNFYFTPDLVTNIPSNVFTVQISESTFLPTYSSTIASVLGTLSSSNASSLSLANSTLTGFKYTLTNQETDLYTVSPTLSASPTLISNTACFATSSCTLTTGQIAIAYVTTGFIVYVNIYSNAGVFQQTLTIGGGYSVQANWVQNFKIVAMASGKFAIIFPASLTTSTLSVYSSSFVATNTLTLTTATSGATNNITIASLTGDNLVVAYANSGGQSRVTVYSNTLTSLYNNASLGSVNIEVSVVGNNYGGFVLMYNTPATPQWTAIAFFQTATTTWSILTTGNNSSAIPSPTTTVNVNAQVLNYSGAGTYSLLVSNSATATSQIVYLYTDYLTPLIVTTGVTTTTSASYVSCAIGQTAYGTNVFAYDNASGSIQIFVGSPSLTQVNSSNTAMNFPSSGGQLTLSTVTPLGASGLGTFPSISPTSGYNCVISFINSNNLPAFLILNAYPFSGNYTITTSQLPNNYVQINPSVGLSGQIGGTLIAGVAATTASAGSTGQLVINGLAQLNSNYSTSNIQSFDFTGQGVDGVRGIVNGRTVNLQGNS